MSKAVGFVMPSDLTPYYQEDRFYNYGDNPAFKKFMKIGSENCRGKKFVDHRTHIINRGVRLSYARNFDDFLQRDINAHTFPRAIFTWTLASLLFYATQRVGRRLIPVGRFGIRKINETQFFQNFGWLGVVGVAGWVGFTAYAWWKVTRFTVHKFYRHVIQQNRNWIHENMEVSRYGNYFYPECILTREDDFHSSKDKKVMFNMYPEDTHSWYGPFTPQSSYDKKEKEKEEKRLAKEAEAAAAAAAAK